MEAHQIENHDLLKWIDEKQPTEVLNLRRHHYIASIYAGHPDGRYEGYTLYWTDGVVNEWGEWYPGLPTALARLAVMEAAGQGHRFFTQKPAEFRGTAKFLFEAALDEPLPGHEHECQWCGDDITQETSGDFRWLSVNIASSETGRKAYCDKYPGSGPWVHQPAEY